MPSAATAMRKSRRCGHATTAFYLRATSQKVDLKVTDSGYLNLTSAKKAPAEAEA
jgi:hypothetical protein